MAEHGTRARYSAGCHCDECRKANRDYERARTMRKVAEECGAPAALVDADPVRKKLMQLRRHGCTEREICRITGLSRSCLNNIMRAHPRTGRPVEKVRRETRDAIFGIESKRMPSAGQNIGAQWMAEWIREYRTCGLSVACMSRISGIDRRVLDGLLHGSRRAVKGKTFHRFLMSKPALDKRAGRNSDD